MPLGTRTGPPLSEAEDGDSANRDELCKILGPKLGRVLPMAADATPGGRPLFLAHARATSAGDGRETAPSLPLLRPMVSDRAPHEQGCVYPNKGPRRDANASAAGAVPPGTRYYLFSEIFSPEWPVKRPLGAPARRKGGPAGLRPVPACC